MDNIVLIGFMGSGKTTLARKLSYKLCRVVQDTDEIIEKEQGKTINDIFNQEGELFFRDLETARLKKMLEETHKRIISVGGGLPLREENRQLLKQLGVVVYLRLTPETVCKRLENDTSRPLLKGEGLREKVSRMMQDRSPFYEDAAHVIVDVDGKDTEVILEEILNRLLIEEERRQA